MDVSNRVNKHFISPVCITADHPRYSLAGWFYPKNTAQRGLTVPIYVLY